MAFSHKKIKLKRILSISLFKLVAGMQVLQSGSKLFGCIASVLLMIFIFYFAPVMLDWGFEGLNAHKFIKNGSWEMEAGLL